MDCFCGCGRKLPGKLVEVNLLTSQVALDLLAWDRARAQGRLGVDAPEFESLIGRGENAYGRLVLFLHGEGRPAAVEEGQAWLGESFKLRAHRRDMTTKGSLISRQELVLDDTDFEALDRSQPGRSFSEREAPQADVADQLARLGRLRAEGVLSEEEFAAAKDRVVRSPRSE